jgi:exodeoxyribonuclease VII large subunit
MRAPTPTAAAEIVTEFQFQLTDKLEEINFSLLNVLKNVIQNNRQRLDLIESRLKNPQVVLNEQKQVIANIALRLKQSAEINISKSQQRLELINYALNEKNPVIKIKELLQKLDKASQEIIKTFSFFLKNKFKDIENIKSNLNAFSPLAVLDRGYAIVQNSQGKAIKSTKEIKKGEVVQTRFSSGSFDSQIQGINHEK